MVEIRSVVFKIREVEIGEILVHVNNTRVLRVTFLASRHTTVCLNLQNRVPLYSLSCEKFKYFVSFCILMFSCYKCLWVVKNLTFFAILWEFSLISIYCFEQVYNLLSKNQVLIRKIYDTVPLHNYIAINIQRRQKEVTWTWTH